MMRGVVAAAVVAAFAAGWPGAALAQGTVKVGFIQPLTGPFASTGRQAEAAARLYMKLHGDTVAGKKIELVVKDDGGVPDQTKRIAQELIVNEKVGVLMGFGLTPLALAVAPLATQAKIPQIVTAAATSSITDASAFVIRTSFTLPQATVPIAEWAAKDGIKTVATLVTDFAPGLDAEKTFKERFTAAGGTIAAELRVPLRNPDFAPFLQRVADAKPQAVFVFVPSGVGAILMKQFAERGLDKSGIRLIATGDVTDDDILNDMGEVALGVVTSHHYSALHPGEVNRSFVDAFRKANGGMRPNFMAVGAYDGMHVVYEALRKTGGATEGPGLLEAMKGLSWESPRGLVAIDPATRELVQNIYIRKVERQDGQLYNVEFATTEKVKDPAKAGR